MKSFANLLHKTPWWALLFGGVAILLALAAFVTPYHIIDYRNEGATVEEKRAIKREIDNTFAENAIDIARGVILSMRGATSDPDRRDELSSALEELESARRELREAGTEALRAKREAIDNSREAAKTARESIEQALKEVEQALKTGGVENETLRKSLQESLEAARKAEAEAESGAPGDPKPRKAVRIGISTDKSKPIIDVQIDDAKPGEKSSVSISPTPDAPPAVPGSTAQPPSPPAKPAPGAKSPPPSTLPIPPVPPLAMAEAPPLPPEFRDKIRRNVVGDMYRIGIGAALMLILIPLFILATVSKFFIDRSRASQRMADLKKTEAEYHRMGQQVTEAKLQALQAQVEPHFLYNTLASVQALTEVDPAQASAMTGHLIHYLRNALPKMREGVSTVGQEIELVRAYLNILQMRMGKRLAFEIEIPEELNAAAFPPLMLPSLVENSIKHGLEPQREGGLVRITAEVRDGKLRLIVADTGKGFGESIGAGVGLANIRERLAGLYGEGGKLTLEANVPQGVVATIEIPEGASAAVSGAAGGSAGKFVAGAAPAMGSTAALAAAPPTFASKTFMAMGAAERIWRKTLSFTFVALVILAAVMAGLGLFGMYAGLLPVEVGEDALSGPGGMIVGTAGIALAFLVIVLALAIVVAVVYGLGFLFVGLAIFIPLVVLVSLSPVLAPIILLGLFIWWLVRKKDKGADKKPEAVPAPLK